MVARTLQCRRARAINSIYVNGSKDIDICLRMTRVLSLKIHQAFEPEIRYLEGRSPGREQQKILNWVAFLRLWEDMISRDDALIDFEDKKTMPTFRTAYQSLAPDYQSLEK